MKKVLVTLVLSAFLITACSVPEKKDIVEQKPASEQKPKTEQDNKAQVGLNIDDIAPDFKLKNIDGEDIKLSDYRGKTVILNFFGVWCVWCRKEMPDFMKVYNEYKDKDVELVIVDSGDDINTVVSYFEENKFDVKPLMDISDTVVRQYRIQGFPTTYIIDKDGITKYVRPGYMDEGTLRNVLETVIE